MTILRFKPLRPGFCLTSVLIKINVHILIMIYMQDDPRPVRRGSLAGFWIVRSRSFVRLAAVPKRYRPTWPGLWSMAAAPDHPGYWRWVLKSVYAHLREGVRTIKKAEALGVKRVNINVEVNLHNAFKATAAAQGTDMTTVLMEFIQNYVAKHGSTTPKKSRRA